jgi:tRNA (guanine-N7-)-methyltransferase
LVIEMYGLLLIEAIDDINAAGSLQKELEIRTHYEGLDIARSKKVYYLSFSLPTELPYEIDTILHERIKLHEKSIG